MNPIITNIEEKGNNTMTFTLSGVNVSLANALRRTILSDINTVVFNTTNYENSSKNCVIFENTSRLNNEIIKQRLSCIPIHIVDLSEGGLEIDKHYMEIKVENDTESTIYVTTEDFKIINRDTKKEIDKAITHEIFKPHYFTGDYIDFIRLRPKVGIIPAEKIHLTCAFSIASAKQDGMFNVVSTCSYGFTVDPVEQDKQLVSKKVEWEGKDADFEEKNWRLLDGLRFTIPDSFDFTIESVGVFLPHDLIKKACNIINRQLDEFVTKLPDLNITKLNNQNTISNCYDITLENDDYTIGKVLEYMMYSKFYEGRGEERVLSFCGYKKMHPHDPHSILRLAFLKDDGATTPLITQNLKKSAVSAIEAFCCIKDIMKAKRK